MIYRIFSVFSFLFVMSFSGAIFAQEEVDEMSEIEQVVEDETEAQAPAKVLNAIGQTEIIKAKFEDTLLELGRAHNLGYVEIVSANPGVDPWLPGEGTKITLPKMHLLPEVTREGLVINLAEMRMYDFTPEDGQPKTYPLGIGREGLNTPLGQTTITRKKDGPSWRPTPRMRKEDPDLPEVVPPGDDNPLGTHALYLGWPQYLIHGTHKPLGVGRRVSSGCIRMYPEDIIKVFEEIPVGTKVTVISQPIKFGWIDDMLYMEAHAEDELADKIEDVGRLKEYRVPETLFAELNRVAGDAKDRLDWQVIRTAVKTRNGMPVAILSSDADPLPEEEAEVILYEEPVIEPKPKRPASLSLNS
jgi:L,D-transpeptidase ErfK/SrfK